MIRSILGRLRLFIVDRNWDSKRKHLINKGAKIGKGTRLNCSINSFGTEPYLIEIGENCLFANDIQFITHDGGIKVLNTLNFFDGKRMDKLGRIRVGNNVYIGLGAYIMPGVTIGDNSIIGANAVVTKDIPSNCVAVGTPARVIKTIEEFYQSSKDNIYPTAGLPSKKKRAYCEDNNI